MEGIREIAWRTYGATELQTTTLVFTLLLGGLILALRRSRALLPLVLAACVIPTSQRLVVASLDFPMIRILLLCGGARLLLRGELRSLRVGALDLAFWSWLLLGTLVHAAREGSEALVYRLGLGFDALGVYLLVRQLIRRPRDLMRLVEQLAWIAVAVALAMAVEHGSGRNPFSVFGDAGEVAPIRDGRLRSSGAFSHPIMAGSFGASAMPLGLGLVLIGRRRLLGILGLLAGTAIAFFSGSSGPGFATAAGLLGWGLWRIRRHLRAFRWGLAGAVVLVHFAREKPVWHLLVRASHFVGGTGWHRYLLIDAFVSRFREWWLLGVSSTAHWGWGLQDVTSQYVLEGVRGGLVTLIAFLAVLGLAFRGLGRSMTPGRESCPQNQLAWALGVALGVHCVSFVSVSYFGQMQLLFFLLFAMIAAQASLRGPRPARRPRARRARERAPEQPTPVPA
jgi:hypothetical protein